MNRRSDAMISLRDKEKYVYQDEKLVVGELARLQECR